MFKNLRRSIGFFFLQKQRPAKRRKKLYNLREAKSVGMLFYLTTEPDWEILRQVYLELTKQKITVSLLGICLEKHLPDWVSKLSFPILTKKDLNFWLLPKAKRNVAGFCATPFDILIDFSTNANIQNLAIVNWSKASLKVGKHDADSLQYYDFVLKDPDASSFQERVKNLLYYLTTIKTMSYEN